jgi:hypothetical protein
LTVAFREDYQVIFGPTDLKPDVTLLIASWIVALGGLAPTQ